MWLEKKNEKKNQGKKCGKTTTNKWKADPKKIYADKKWS